MTDRELIAEALALWLQPATWLRADNDEVLGQRHSQSLAAAVLAALAAAGRQIIETDGTYYAVGEGEAVIDGVRGRLDHVDAFPPNAFVFVPSPEDTWDLSAETGKDG
jgi:hypothetical protein